MTDLAVIIPTHDRAALLQSTLDCLGSVRFRSLTAEVVVVDNGSRTPIRRDMATSLENGWPVTVVRNEDNLGAAGRNLGCQHTAARWSLMLDDDSAVPYDGAGPLEDLVRWADGEADLFAIGGRITLPGGRHEAGGAPEVFVGCGALLRTDVFLQLEGYDPAFEYYAEEYDLCARAIAAGWRMVHDARLGVLHRKSAVNRDLNRILRLLVRNNGWVAARHAPDGLIDDEVMRLVERYGRIAVKEGAEAGFEIGLDELRATLDRQKHRPLTPEQYDRFRGTSAVRAWLTREIHRTGATRARIVAPGKGVGVVESVLRECGVDVDKNAAGCPCAVIGSISPGPIEDAMQDHADRYECILRPWPAFGSYASIRSARSSASPANCVS